MKKRFMFHSAGLCKPTLSSTFVFSICNTQTRFQPLPHGIKWLKKDNHIKAQGLARKKFRIVLHVIPTLYFRARVFIFFLKPAVKKR